MPVDRCARPLRGISERQVSATGSRSTKRANAESSRIEGAAVDMRSSIDRYASEALPRQVL